MALVVLLALSENVMIFSEVPSWGLKNNICVHIYHTWPLFVKHFGSRFNLVNSKENLNQFKSNLIEYDDRMTHHRSCQSIAPALQAYSLVEIFCGHAWVSRVMRCKGHATAQMDILLTKETFRSSPPNPMDLLTDSGFLPPVPNYFSFVLAEIGPLKAALIWVDSYKNIHHMLLKSKAGSGHYIEWAIRWMPLPLGYGVYKFCGNQ